MPNYENSKVYKLMNSVDGKIYIGSTTQSLSMRLTKHKNTAKLNPAPAHRHLNTIGWDKVRIVLLETVNCFNKEQLIQREQHYIDLLKPSLNGYAAYVDCPHGRQHNNCIECHGSSICEHNKRKQQCKECHGISICIHNKQKQYCKECHGVSICDHNKKKSNCKICSPIHCLYCDITISSGSSSRHTKTKKHIYNFIYS